jgi:ArsR family transcriptional regulator
VSRINPNTNHPDYIRYIFLDIVAIFRNNATMKQVFNMHAEVCKTLANPKRLEIIYALKEGELSVGELVKRLGIPKANVSQHLAILRQRRVLVSRREGVNIYYRISNPKIVKACALMREVLMQQLAEGGKLVKKAKAS